MNTLEEIILHLLKTLGNDDAILSDNLQYLAMVHYDITEIEYKIAVDNLIKDDKIFIEGELIYLTH
jgi:hypothetical protein